MKLLKILQLTIVISLISGGVKAEHLPIGSTVLANCFGFSAKGKIKRMHKEHYVVNFYKDSRPVHCTPFAWESRFLVLYTPVSEHKGKTKTKSLLFSVTNDEVFKKGDQLKIDFEAKSRGAMFYSKYTVTAKIIDIDASGSAQFEAISGETKAQQVFQRWVGSNYVSLDFTSKLVADKLSILYVDKL